MKTILFQGDSITDAGRFKEDAGNLGMGYPNLVSAQLAFDNPMEYLFINKGISGNRIVDLYARIKNDIINLKPDILSILIGVNDVWHEFGSKNGVDAEKYFRIYCIMIEEIKQALPNIQIIILEPFVLKASATEANWEIFYQEVLKRAEKAKEVAEKYHLTFVPLQEKFEQAAKNCPANYWLADGVHPTAAGHELIKRTWINTFYGENNKL